MSGSLLRSTAVVSAMTLLSRISGFARDVIFAQAFGAGAGMDAFLVAWRIPNLFRRISAEGAFALAFVPVLAEYRKQRPEALRELLDRVCGTLALLLFALSLLGVLIAPWLILLFAPGFAADADKYAASVTMLRLTFPYIFFISLVAAAGGVLNSYGRFAVPALTPVLLNLSMIAAALGLAPYFAQPTEALAWGVLAAGVLQLALQLPFLYRLGLLPRPRWGWAHDGVRRIVRLMVPTLLGSSAGQVNILLNTVLASFLLTGSVSWLYYTDRLIEFPLGMFGVALGTVLLPRLSQLHNDGADRDGFSHALNWGLRGVVLIGMPAAAALTVLAGPLLTTLFHYGEFGADDVLMTRRSLVAAAFGLFGFMLIKVLAPGFHARQDSRTPMRFGLIQIAVNIVLTLLLVWPLAHAGLALAAALAAYVNAALLLLRLRRDRVFRAEPGWPRFLGTVLAAVLAMSAALYWAAGDLDDWLAASAAARALWLGGLVTGGAVCYAAVLTLLGLRPRHLKL